jgi:hypothetical protein
MAAHQRRKHSDGNHYRRSNLIRRVCHWSCYWTLTIVVSTVAFAHSGGIDGRGGHNGPGGYHFHGGSGGGVPSSGGGYFTGFPAFSMPVVRTKPRRKPNLTYYATARAAKEESRAQRSIEINSDLEERPARYEFHHIEHDPYLALSFTEIDRSWRLETRDQLFIRLPKDKIVRIEAILDPRDFRTWIDSTGRFSVVAKFMEQLESKVRLSKLNDSLLEVGLDKLSEVDRDHVAETLKSGR